MQTSTTLILALVCVCAFVSLPLVWSQGTCSTPCFNNNECQDPSLACPKCNVTTPGTRGTCIKGGGCGDNCTVDSDCSIFTGCDQCSNGHCAQNPHGCGVLCYNNNDCSDPYCSRCSGRNGAQGQCAPGLGCAGDCDGDADCNTLSSCKFCIGKKCSIPCQRGNCTKDTDCEAACGKCVSGLCEKALDFSLIEDKYKMNKN